MTRYTALSLPGTSDDAKMMVSPGSIVMCRWSREAMVPAVKAAMPDKNLTGLVQASAYVCRNRNNASNGKVSEHAFGNAVDIAAFTFSSGMMSVTRTLTIS